MAKGDSNDAQKQIDTQGGKSQDNLNGLNTRNQQQYDTFSSLYGPAAQTNVNNYNQVQSAYDSYLSGMPNAGSLYNTFLGNKYSSAQPQAAKPAVDENAHPVDQLLAKYNAKDTGPGSGVTDASYWKEKYDSTGDKYYLERLEGDLKGGGMDAYSPGGGGSSSSSSMVSGPLSKAIAGYSDFADTGGFSPQDISNIRARAVAPIRSMAATNADEINRQNAIRGTAYSPNTVAALTKLARDANYAAGDTATNAEASIAQMRQQGRLYGLGGLSSTGLANQSNETANRGLDLNAIEGASGNALSALGGKTAMYGATPGLTNMFGNQVLGSGEQGIQGGGLQNQLAQMIINGQIGKAQIPGNFQSAMGNIGSGLSLVGNIAGGLMGLPKIGGGGGGGGDIFQ